MFIEDNPVFLIEVKLTDSNLNNSFFHFEKYFPGCQKIQLVKDIKREKTFDKNTEIRKLSTWLSKIPIQNG